MSCNCGGANCRVVEVQNPTGDGFGIDPIVNHDGSGTVTVTDAQGNQFELNVCDLVSACPTGMPGDGFGSNPPVTDNGDGSVTVADQQGNFFIIDICNVAQACNFGFGDTVTAVDNGDGTITIEDGQGNSVDLDICAVIANCDWSQFPLPEVNAGTGVTVTTGTGANGQTIYTVNSVPTVDLRLVSGTYNPATNTIEFVVDDGAGGNTTTIQVPVPEIAEEVDNTVTAASVGTPAPTGIEWGVDPATGDIFYVDAAGNWAQVPSDADGFGTNPTVVDNGNGTITVTDEFGNSFTLDIGAAQLKVTRVECYRFPAAGAPFDLDNLAATQTGVVDVMTDHVTFTAPVAMTVTSISAMVSSTSASTSFFPVDIHDGIGNTGPVLASGSDAAAPNSVSQLDFTFPAITLAAGQSVTVAYSSSSSVLSWVTAAPTDPVIGFATTAADPAVRVQGTTSAGTGTATVVTCEDGTRRAFNDADNTEIVITGGIPATWVPCPDGIGVDTNVTDPGDGTLVITDADGNFLVLDICAAIQNCSTGGGDGLGPNTTATVPGDGTVVIADDQGNSVTVDVCAAIAGCDPNDIPTSIVDQGDGTVTVNGELLDVCAAVANCDWSAFPLPVVQGGNGATVTTSTGPGGETVYTVDVACPALQAVECWEAPAAGGGGTQAVTPTGINNRFQDTAAINDFNAVMAGTAVVLSSPLSTFTDPFVNPAPGNGLAFPNAATSDQLWNLNLPANATEITLCLSESSSDAAFGYGAYLVDSSTMTTLPITSHTGGIFGGTGNSGIGLGNNGTATATWDLSGVNPADVRMIAGSMGTNAGNLLTDEVTFTCADAAVPAGPGDRYTVTRCPDGTATAVNQTDGTDIQDVTAGIPATWTLCDDAAGDGIGGSTTIVDNNDGTLTITDGTNSATVDICAVASSCPNLGDGFGGNPTVTPDGAGAVTVDDGQGNQFVVDVCALVADCDWSTFPLPVIEAGNGITVTTSTGPGGETVYTVDAACPALQAVECWEDPGAGGGGTQSIVFNGIGTRVQDNFGFTPPPSDDLNVPFGAAVHTVTHLNGGAPFNLAFVNTFSDSEAEGYTTGFPTWPADSLYEAVLPAGTTTVTFDISETSSTSGAGDSFGLTIFDPTTGAVLPFTATGGVAASGPAAILVDDNSTAQVTVTIPAGVATLGLITSGIGTNSPNSGRFDVVEITNSQATVTATGPTRYTVTRCPDGTATAVNQTDGTDIVDVTAGIPAAWVACNDAAGDGIGATTTIVDNNDGTLTITDGTNSATVDICAVASHCSNLGDGIGSTTTATPGGDGTVTIDDGQGNTLVVDVCALVADCDWSTFPLPEVVAGDNVTVTTATGPAGQVIYTVNALEAIVEAGPGISVTPTPGPNPGETVYTVEFDPTSLTTDQLMDLCAALATVDCDLTEDMPRINLLKTWSSPDDPVREGSVITYTFTALNTGNVDLLAPTIDDPTIGITGLAMTPSPLLPGQTATAQATYTVNAIDASAGNVTNQATVNATDPAGQPVTDVSDDPTTVPIDDSTIVPVVGTADVQVAKVVDNATPAVGDTVTFTVTATNLGPDPAETIVLSDLIPAGLTYVSDSPTQGTYTPGSGVWAVGDLAVAAAAVLTLSATVDPTSAGLTIANTAQVVSTFTNDPNPANDADSATVDVLEPGEVQLVKVVDSTGPYSLGDTISGHFEITNIGPVPLTNLVVNDPNAIVTGSPVAGPLTAGSTDSTVTWSHIVTQTDVDAAQFSNQATVTGDDGTPTSVTDNSSTTANPTGNDPTVTPIAQNPAIDLLKTADAAGVQVPPVVGDPVVYTFTATNTGDVTLTAPTINDPVIGITGLALAPATLAPGQTATGTVTYPITQGDINATQIVNTATVTAQDPQGGNVSDTSDDPTDTTSTNDPTVVSLAPPDADIAVTKSVSDPTPAEGDTITFTVTATNLGPDDATDVVITDALPAGLTYVSHTGTGTYTPLTSLWNVGTITNGATSTLTITATVDAGTAGTTITNVASYTTSTSVDNNPGNNTGTAVVSPTGAAQLQVTKTANPTSAAPGDTITYSVTVTNTGTGPATGVVVQDPIQPEVTYNTGSITGGDSNNESDPTGAGLQWTVNTLPAGGSQTFTYTADAAAAGGTPTGGDGQVTYQRWDFGELGSKDNWFTSTDPLNHLDDNVNYLGDVDTRNGATSFGGTVPVNGQTGPAWRDDGAANNGNYVIREGWIAIPCGDVEFRTLNQGVPADGNAGNPRENLSTFHIDQTGGDNPANVAIVSWLKVNFNGGVVTQQESGVINPAVSGSWIPYVSVTSDGADFFGTTIQWQIDGGGWQTVPDSAFSTTPGQDVNCSGPSTSTNTATANAANAGTATGSATVNIVSGVAKAGGTPDDQFTFIDTPDSFDASTLFVGATSYSATGLPPGFTINPTTGVISGSTDIVNSTNTNFGAYNVVVTASDGTNSVPCPFVWEIGDCHPTSIFSTNFNDYSGPNNGALPTQGSGAGFYTEQPQSVNYEVHGGTAHILGDSVWWTDGALNNGGQGLLVIEALPVTSGDCYTIHWVDSTVPSAGSPSQLTLQASYDGGATWTTLQGPYQPATANSDFSDPYNGASRHFVNFTPTGSTVMFRWNNSVTTSNGNDGGITNVCVYPCV